MDFKLLTFSSCLIRNQTYIFDKHIEENYHSRLLLNFYWYCYLNKWYLFLALQFLNNFQQQQHKVSIKKIIFISYKEPINQQTLNFKDKHVCLCINFWGFLLLIKIYGITWKSWNWKSFLFNFSIDNFKILFYFPNSFYAVIFNISKFITNVNCL